MRSESKSHLRWLAAGLLVGLVFLGGVPAAARWWLRVQTEADRAAIRTYLEATRDLRAPPSRGDYSPTDVLAKLENYQAPPLPRGLLSWLTGNLEPYDSRIRSRKPVPPTRADTLVEDVEILFARFFSDSSSPHGQAEVARALGIYLYVPWTSLPGYRPWTHWNFARSLNELERNTLARQVAWRMKAPSQRSP